MVAPVAAAKQPREEEPAMDAIVDAKGQESDYHSGHRMLIKPGRVVYAGLLGRPRERCPGAFYVYVAIRDGLHLSTSDGRQAHGELVVTMPNLCHTITSEYRSAISVAIEPESVPDGTLDAVARRLQGPDSALFANRIRAAYARLAEMQYR